MIDSESVDRERIKQHFAQRVIYQANQVLDVWQRLQYGEWSSTSLNDLRQANLQLLRHAERFEQNQHCQLSRQIADCLQAIESNSGQLNSELIGKLNLLLQKLSGTGLSINQPTEATSLPQLRKPVYLALPDHARASYLARQLQCFGLSASAFNGSSDFIQAMAEREPAAIVMDLDFAGPRQGLKLAAEMQQVMDNPLPLVFCSSNTPDSNTRLQAAQAGGKELLTGGLDASSLIERIEILSKVADFEPFKVLIIDAAQTRDSQIAPLLNNAGMITSSISEPGMALDALADFQPDLVILDMDMPACSGPDLARAIRFSDQYLNLPLLYLSSRDDLDHLIAALSEGDDDFLAKPVQPGPLIAIVRNRIAHARNLKSRIVRDHLTGLFNHTHTLYLLEQEQLRAQRSGLPLSFAVIDIDHFKIANDTHGYPLGDRVIKSLALFLKRRLRKSDHIGRLGGEEIAVILPDTDIANACKVLDDIRSRFAEINFSSEEPDLYCTFSCGIADLQEGMDVKRLARSADDALWKAKNAGRNQVICSIPEDN
jgi:diguanylate cyclase (GGDEF)-like protein